MGLLEEKVALAEARQALVLKIGSKGRVGGRGPPRGPVWSWGCPHRSVSGVSGRGPCRAAWNRQRGDAGRGGDGNIFLFLKGDLEKECSRLPASMAEEEMPGLEAAPA